MKKLLTLVLMMLAVSLTYADSCMQFPVSLEERVANSQIIVEGTIINQFSKWNDDHTMINTFYEVEPSTFYKGKYSDTILVKTQGGELDGEMFIVEPSLKLELNQAGVFFLQQDGFNTYKPYAVNQGAYLYNYDSDKATSVFDSYDLSTFKLDDSIVEITKQEAKKVRNQSLKVKSIDNHRINASVNMVITSLSHTEINAGEGEVLTIKGSGFGDERGNKRVGFKHADYRTGKFYPNFGYELWSDTEIKVVVPHDAGSQRVVIAEFVNNNTTILAKSEDQIRIPFNRATTSRSEMYIDINLINRNNLGGYSFTPNKSFVENEDAYLRLKEVLAYWSNASGVNWDVATDVSDVSNTSRDGINNIAFSDKLPAGVLGATTSHLKGKEVPTSDKFIFYVDEIDMLYNSAINWNFTEEKPTSTQFDFYTVLLHELGHGHQLGHVVDTGSVMNFSTGKGRFVRTLTEEEKAGARRIVQESLSIHENADYGPMEAFHSSSVNNLEVGTCNEFNYGETIYNHKWHSITTDNNELVLQFNPKGNSINDITISVYFDDSQGLVKSERQFEIHAIDENGDIMSLTEPMSIRLVYAKEEIDSVLVDAGVASIDELTFSKNNSSCGDTFNPSNDSTVVLKMSDFGLGGDNSYVLETEVEGFSSFFATSTSTALPVVWGDFIAKQVGGDVQLDWSTISEENASHFDVERSNDGLQWDVIAQVTAAGFSSRERNYNFNDTKPESGVNYYRLNQVDFDGSKEFSSIIKVIFENTSDLINYSNGALEINPDRNTNVSLFAITGQLVKQVDNITNRETIDVSDLSKGTYVVVCESGNNKTIVKVGIH